jgi:hypothetical protein
MITDIVLPLIIYLLGSLFILTVLEPAEDSDGRGLLILAFTWPLYTIYLVLQEIIYGNEE